MESKPKILIIEDTQAMIDFVRFVLEQNGFDVTSARGGQEGLDQVRQERPALILLDLMMPGMSGWEVYRRLRTDDEFKDIPVIVVTAKGQKIDKAIGLQIARVDDYIIKPFPPSDLLDSINRVLRRY